MIEVHTLRNLIQHQQQRLEDVEQIFRALLGFPDEERIHNATRLDMVNAFDAACESLIGDQNDLPAGTRAILASMINGPTPDTYASAVNAISADVDSWHRRLTK